MKIPGSPPLNIHFRGWGIMWGDKGRQDLGKADTPSNTGTHMWGDNGRQGETRPREGRHTIPQRHTCGETMGDKERQKGRQDFGKADTPSNTETDTLRKHYIIRTPNSTLFGEKSLGAVAPCAFLDQIHHKFCRAKSSHFERMTWYLHGFEPWDYGRFLLLL